MEHLDLSNSDLSWESKLAEFHKLQAKIISPKKLSIAEIEFAIALAQIYEKTDTPGFYAELIKSLKNELEEKGKA